MGQVLFLAKVRRVLRSCAILGLEVGGGGGFVVVFVKIVKYL
jgi:hypothetical protein